MASADASKSTPEVNIQSWLMLRREKIVSLDIPKSALIARSLYLSEELT